MGGGGGLYFGLGVEGGETQTLAGKAILQYYDTTNR